MMKKILAVFLLLPMVLGLCAFPAAAESAEAEEREASPEWVGRLEQAANAEQLFVVAGVGETTAYISMHEKDDNGVWREVMSTPGFIGKYGLGKTREGDGKTPVGTFGFNYAFGIAEDPGCAMEYHQVDDNAYWSGDQRDGCHYNEMVSIRDLPDLNTEDSEHIMDYTAAYQYCLNISYNAEGTPGLGSAIFLHCFREDRPYTGGCVAIPENQMITVMQNVRPDCVVLIDSLRNISPETWDDWGLTPAAESTEGSVEIDEYVFTLPEEYADRLIVKYGEDGMLVSVYEKASVEAAQAEGWEDQDGAGWLFSLGKVSADRLHEMLCWDMSGVIVFAEDAEGQYWLFYHPTDVRLVREGNAYDDEAMAQWTELNEWANSVQETFIQENEGLTAVSYDNSDVAIALARTSYADDAYEFRTLQYYENSPLDPLDVDSAPYVERLIRNAKYTYVDEAETPDGEYLVLYFPEMDLRFDFFQAGGNYVRRTSDNRDFTTLYQVILSDGEESMSSIVQEWINEVAAANGLT